MQKKLSIDYFDGKNKQYITDGLTGAIIKSEILGYISFLCSNNIPFSVYFMDLDYFKTINDTYGHSVGDMVLKKIANGINSCLSDDAILGRFGGDEFIIVQKGVTDYEPKWQLARKICLSISNLKYDFGDGHENQTTSMTIGIASYPEDSNTDTGVMECADKALYRGKQKGRNCFIIYDKQKHENLKIDLAEEEKNVSTLIDMVFNEFTNPHIADIDRKFNKIITYLSHLYAIDRVCLYKDDGFKMLYKMDDFDYPCFPIPIEKYNKIGYLNKPYLAINFRIHYIDEDNEMFKLLEEQNTNAQVVIRIRTHANDYGYIRLDKRREIIWKPDLINVFQVVAGLYAIGLEKNTN